MKKVLLRRLYESHKIIYYPIFGWFPVKLTTFVGEPIDYFIDSDEKVEVEEIALKTQQSLESLIDAHQNKQISIVECLLDRFGRMLIKLFNF